MDILEKDKLRNGICENLTLKELNNNMVSLSISYTQMSKDVINHLDIEYGKKTQRLLSQNFQKI